MKIVAPDYYPEFHCIAGECRHTCCQGWEVDIDEETLAHYAAYPEIMEKIGKEETPHFRLEEEERCPFLRKDGLCELIVRHGEGILAQICRDHPRFRNFWSDRTEIGLGLVCEEAGRLILGREKPMTLITLSDDGEEIALSEEEEWLLSYRDALLSEIREEGPRARLMEYLIYRHLPDALYDGLVEERLAFIRASFKEITRAWERSEGCMEEMVETVRKWSYDVEYDEEELEKRIKDPRE